MKIHLAFIRQPVLRMRQSLRRLPYHLDLILLCMALIAATMGLAMLTASKSGEVLAHLNARIDARADRKVSIKRLPLRLNEYQQYAPTMVRLNPGVNFTLTPDGSALVLTIAVDDLFPDMIMALQTLQAFKPGVAWEMVEFCAHKCNSEGVVARAVVKGFTQEISQ